MINADLNPSLAWRRDVFNSQPRRDIRRLSKTTTRVPVIVPIQSCVMYAEGGNEATALLLLRHLQHCGLVKRFKAQAFSMDELGGPSGRVPDILVELATDLSLHSIGCKAKRFLTPDVQEAFNLDKAFLQPLGFTSHVWTDRDRLANPTSQTVRLIDRGFRSPPNVAMLHHIEQQSKKASVLGQLFKEYGFDDTLAASAHGAFQFDITKAVNENTPILHHIPPSYYSYLFQSRSISHGSWWDSLEDRRTFR
jgi:hypothetical protein